MYIRSHSQHGTCTVKLNLEKRDESRREGEQEGVEGAVIIEREREEEEVYLPLSSLAFCECIHVCTGCIVHVHCRELV